MTIQEASQSLGMTVVYRHGYTEEAVRLTGVSECRRYAFVQRHSGWPSEAVSIDNLYMLEGVQR